MRARRRPHRLATLFESRSCEKSELEPDRYLPHSREPFPHSGSGYDDAADEVADRVSLLVYSHKTPNLFRATGPQSTYCCEHSCCQRKLNSVLLDDHLRLASRRDGLSLLGVAFVAGSGRRSKRHAKSAVQSHLNLNKRYRRATKNSPSFELASKTGCSELQ
jgi:hypothetical protein